MLSLSLVRKLKDLWGWEVSRDSCQRLYWLKGTVQSLVAKNSVVRHESAWYERNDRSENIKVNGILSVLFCLKLKLYN